LLDASYFAAMEDSFPCIGKQSIGKQ